MQVMLKKRLTKVALALAVAGYCVVPAASADGNLKGVNDVWQVSASTGTIQGTAPRIKLPGAPDSPDIGANVKVTIDRGGRTVATEGDKQLHIGDKITVEWAINDTEGDKDTNNAKTIPTIQWMRYTDQSKSDAELATGEGAAGSTTYTVTEDDAGLYIGLRLTPTTETGDPNVGALVDLADISSSAGGGADDDDIPTGPVVDDSVVVAIYDAA